MTSDRISAPLQSDWRRDSQRESGAWRTAQLGVNLTLLGPAAALGVGLLVSVVAALL